MIARLKKITEDFLSELNDIEAGKPKIMDRAVNSIILCRQTLHDLKSELLRQDFKNIENEIEFFKHTKQISITPLIYYSEIRSFELQYPLGNPRTQKKYTNKKISKLNRFFNLNIDFIQYIQQDHSHFDHQYFSRKFADSYHIVSSKFYFQDPDFTTSRDMLLGKVTAYRRFIEYLKDRKTTRQNGFTSNLPETKFSKLKWTSSKAALTELIYALYASGVLNNGNADIKEIALALQRVFHFELNEFYKIYAEIKYRKHSRTKFLDKMAVNLISLMDESENQT